MFGLGQRCCFLIGWLPATKLSVRCVYLVRWFDLLSPQRKTPHPESADARYTNMLDF